MYKKIFIIDDDEVSSFLTEATLAEEAFAQAYECYHNGKEALEALLPLLQGQPAAPLPDLILLDLNMPVISGWGFLEALAPYAAQLQGRCLIYILTSSVDEEEVKRANENELVAGFLHKPLIEDSILRLKQARR